MSPDAPDALYVLGISEVGLSHLKEAKAAFEAAVDSQETHVPSLFQLGLLAQQAHDDTTAIARLQRVLQIDPDHERAQAALGTSLARHGTDDASAERLLRAALRINPKFGSGHTMLAEVLARRGNIKEAKGELEAAIRLKPDDAALKARLVELTAALKSAKKTPVNK